ncbi:SDR family oxidoreductase [Ferrimonas gelatinilytica]|uniref:SDR family oxidoreductase n=1 Tax=Ferrimonas gelatinilytica TaxID=1255257 RepID=A0ABP9S1E7_9GAMM
MSQRVSIVGCGWLGMPLALHLQSQGWGVTGSGRREETLQALAEAGIPGSLLVIGEQIQCDAPDTLFAADTLIINVPPGREEQDNSYGERMALLAELAVEHGIRQALFVSSTSVYQDGPTFPECDELAPLSDSPRARMMRLAEQVVRDRFAKVIVLRPSGLVGGERHPGRFLAGRKGLTGAEAPVNLVHRDDVIGAIQCLISRGPWGETFNLSAPLHPTRGDFYPRAALGLGLCEPEFSDAPLPGKRICSDKLVQSMGFHFRYPDPLTMPPLGN